MLAAGYQLHAAFIRGIYKLADLLSWKASLLKASLLTLLWSLARYIRSRISDSRLLCCVPIPQCMSHAPLKLSMPLVLLPQPDSYLLLYNSPLVSIDLHVVFMSTADGQHFSELQYSHTCILVLTGSLYIQHPICTQTHCPIRWNHYPLKISNTTSTSAIAWYPPFQCSCTLHLIDVQVE